MFTVGRQNNTVLFDVDRQNDTVLFDVGSHPSESGHGDQPTAQRTGQ